MVRIALKKLANVCNRILADSYFEQGESQPFNIASFSNSVKRIPDETGALCSILFIIKILTRTK